MIEIGAKTKILPPYLFECDYALRHRKMSMNFLDQKAHQQKDIINAELIYTIDENTNHEFGQDSLTMFESDMKEGTESAENIISAMKQQAQTRGRDLQSYHTNQRRAGLLADYNLGRIIKEKHPTHYEGIITNLETGEKTRMGESRNDNQR